MIASELYTMHQPKNHSAHLLNGLTLVEAQPTEIDLVRKLSKLGINLRGYQYFNNRGTREFLITNWRRDK